eukprot:jgi/Mesen1/5563/ME000280S04688
MKGYTNTRSILGTGSPKPALRSASLARLSAVEHRIAAAPAAAFAAPYASAARRCRARNRLLQDRIQHLAPPPPPGCRVHRCRCHRRRMLVLPPPLAGTRSRGSNDARHHAPLDLTISEGPDCCHHEREPLSRTAAADRATLAQRTASRAAACAAAAAYPHYYSNYVGLLCLTRSSETVQKVYGYPCPAKAFSPQNFNYPSIAVPALSLRAHRRIGLKFGRRLRLVGPPATYRATVVAPAGVVPATLKFTRQGKDGERAFQVIFFATSVTVDSYRASEGSNDARHHAPLDLTISEGPDCCHHEREPLSRTAAADRATLAQRTASRAAACAAAAGWAARVGALEPQDAARADHAVPLEEDDAELGGRAQLAKWRANVDEVECVVEEGEPRTVGHVQRQQPPQGNGLHEGQPVVPATCRNRDAQLGHAGGERAAATCHVQAHPDRPILELQQPLDRFWVSRRRSRSKSKQRLQPGALARTWRRHVKFLHPNDPHRTLASSGWRHSDSGSASGALYDGIPAAKHGRGGTTHLCAKMKASASSQSRGHMPRHVTSMCLVRYAMLASESAPVPAPASVPVSISVSVSVPVSESLPADAWSERREASHSWRSALASRMSEIRRFSRPEHAARCLAHSPRMPSVSLPARDKPEHAFRINGSRKGGPCCSTSGSQQWRGRGKPFRAQSEQHSPMQSQQKPLRLLQRLPAGPQKARA